MREATTAGGATIEVGQTWLRPDGTLVEVADIDPPTVQVTVKHGAGRVAADARRLNDFDAFTRVERWSVVVTGTAADELLKRLANNLEHYISMRPTEAGTGPSTFELDVWVPNEASARRLIESKLTGTSANVASVAPA